MSSAIQIAQIIKNINQENPNLLNSLYQLSKIVRDEPNLFIPFLPSLLNGLKKHFKNFNENVILWFATFVGSNLSRSKLSNNEIQNITDILNMIYEVVTTYANHKTGQDKKVISRYIQSYSRIFNNLISFM